MGPRRNGGRHGETTACGSNAVGDYPGSIADHDDTFNQDAGILEKGAEFHDELHDQATMVDRDDLADTEDIEIPQENYGVHI